MRWRWILGGLILGWGGCALREAPAPPSPLPELLQTADARWERRGEVGLEAVDEALQRAYQANAEDPDVLWRMIRLSIARGLVDAEPRASEYAYSEGRSIGVQCLDLDRVFPQRRAEYGWERALEDLAPTYAPCGAWMGLAWARWIKAHGGAAAAVDLPRVDALLRYAAVGEAWQIREPIAWAEGVLAAVRPAWDGQDLEVAEARLLWAAELTDEDASVLMDLVELVWIPRGEIGRAREVLQDLAGRTTQTPEGARVRERAAALRPTLPAAPEAGSR